MRLRCTHGTHRLDDSLEALVAYVLRSGYEMVTSWNCHVRRDGIKLVRRSSTRQPNAEDR